MSRASSGSGRPAAPPVGRPTLRALLDAADGEPLPCARDPEAWIGERAPSPRAAATMCAPCPVTALCAEHASAVDATFGVWAGRVAHRTQYGTRRRRAGL